MLRPSVNQITSAYTGRMPALQDLVEKDKQANNGIPSDLRKLLALQDLTSDQQHMGINQAMQGPQNPPTVSQSLQDRAKQILQARMTQAQQNNAIAQQQQQGMISQGRPGPVPAGVPQPQRQPEGIDQLMSNVGESYARGGIVAFDEGDQVIDPMLGTIQTSSPPSKNDDLTLLERMGILNPENRRAIEKHEFDRRVREEQAKNPVKKEESQAAPTPEAAKETAPEAPKNVKQRITKTTNKPSIANLPTLPPELPAPAAGSPRDILGKSMALDPDAEMNRILAAREKLVGAPDTSQYQALIDELRGQKTKLQQKPEKGYDSLMEYFGEIAAGPTVGRSGKAGAQAAERLRLRELDKEKQANALSERMIEAAQKQQEAIYGYKKEGFTLSEAERARVFKERYDAAKAAGESDDRAKKMAQDAVLERERNEATVKAAGINAGARQGQLMDVAQALMKADSTGKLTLPKALEQASQYISGPAYDSAAVRNLEAYRKAEKDLDESLLGITSKSKTAEGKKAKQEYDAKLLALQQRYGIDGAGLNSLPSNKAGVKILSIEPSPK
jgi:hypothetical protein